MRHKCSTVLLFFFFFDFSYLLAQKQDEYITSASQFDSQQCWDVSENQGATTSISPGSGETTSPHFGRELSYEEKADAIYMYGFSFI